MREKETLSKGEELLRQVLDECLEEDLSFIPPEREIARVHRFSARFEEAVKVLLEGRTEHHKEQEIRRHFTPRYAHLAACVLLFCVCGGLFWYVIQPLTQKGAMEGITEFDVAAEESAPAEAAPEAPAAAQGEVKEEMKEEPAEPESETGLASEQTYCGQTVYLAEQQEVPEYLDYVTTLVNCPVLDEGNPVLFLTIGNIGREPVRYLTHYDLEVYLDGGWYIIPSRSDSPGEWMTLEPGMAVDEEINVADYQVDFDEQQYRLITYVGEELISAEFTFTEVFEETMEQLEEESSGE